MLQLLEAETVVDKVTTTKLAEAMVDIIASGTLDILAKENTTFHTISYSRLGGFGDPELTKFIFSELKERGLARDSQDGVSIPMHPMVRALVLTLLSQILRPYGRNLDLELSPATDRPKLVESLSELLSLQSTPSTGSVVAFDMETVGVDLSSIPFDEVLGFRKEYGAEHRTYARAVRKFVKELSLMTEEERTLAFEDRQAEIQEMARNLKNISRKAWRKPASFALSIAGAAWTLATGNPIGAILAASSAALGHKPSEDNIEGAYSYLFRAATRHV